MHALNHYELTRFDNVRGAVEDPLERRLASSLMKGGYKDSLQRWGSNSIYPSKSVASLHRLHDYEQRTKNFFTPVVKKELAFSDEERVLQRTMNPAKLSQRYTSIINGGASTWDKDDFYNRTVKFNR